MRISRSSRSRHHYTSRTRRSSKSRSSRSTSSRRSSSSRSSSRTSSRSRVSSSKRSTKSRRSTVKKGSVKRAVSSVKRSIRKGVRSVKKAIHSVSSSVKKATRKVTSSQKRTVHHTAHSTKKTKSSAKASLKRRASSIKKKALSHKSTSTKKSHISAGSSVRKSTSKFSKHSPKELKHIVKSHTSKGSYPTTKVNKKSLHCSSVSNKNSSKTTGSSKSTSSSSTRKSHHSNIKNIVSKAKHKIISTKGNKKASVSLGKSIKNSNTKISTSVEKDFKNYKLKIRNNPKQTCEPLNKAMEKVKDYINKDVVGTDTILSKTDISCATNSLYQHLRGNILVITEEKGENIAYTLNAPIKLENIVFIPSIAIEKDGIEMSYTVSDDKDGEFSGAGIEINNESISTFIKNGVETSTGFVDETKSKTGSIEKSDVVTAAESATTKAVAAGTILIGTAIIAGCALNDGAGVVVDDGAIPVALAAIKTASQRLCV